MGTASAYFDIYLAVQSDTQLYIKGRLLAGKRPRYSPDMGYLRSLWVSLRKAMSHELEDQSVALQIGDEKTTVTTDDEGYLTLLEQVPAQGIPKVTLSTNYKETPITVQVTIDQYPIGQHFTVTDIDETLLVTGVRSYLKWQLVINSLLINPFQRKAIDHAADLLHQYATTYQSVTCYLSNSPWNWVHYLRAFLQAKSFPAGLVILRDYGLQLMKGRSLEQRSKYKELHMLFQVFPESRFTLIGDTAEHDFAIYTALAELSPNQVHQIILRKVGNAPLEDLVRAYATTSAIEVRLVKSYKELLEAVEH